ncbi:MAG: LamG domain-containing protein [Lewinellaceae bacterium]|nr:LamG domain-containing protein [Phaeodactylibacter sp.]MCB9352313.1 LamG domain-containing protein [Lewinellaceae bacterium]
MGKIIGRGVLLLTTTPNGPKFKFGYQLSSTGIQFSIPGGDSAPQTLKQAVRQHFSASTSSVTGQGHLILNALPASPNDAFYDVAFRATRIGTSAESFSLQVKESGSFAQGPQSHFSNLDLTFKYKESEGLSIDSGGKVTLHLGEGVFNGEEAIILSPEWNPQSETLIFSAGGAGIQMDSIGKLSTIVVEVGSAYDRWSQVQSLYTFDGGLSDGAGAEKAAHDISGKEAPSLYFKGDKTSNVPPNYGASWTERGIALDGGLLASQDKEPNPVVDAILETGDFSVELWMKPAHPPLSEQNTWLFAFQGKREGQAGKNPYNFFLGQGPWSTGPDGPGTYLNAKFNFPETGVPDLNGRRWESPLPSPAHSLGTELVHVVYSCSRDGMQRIFINGVEVAQRFDPGYDNRWEGGLRIAVGANLPGGPGNINPSIPWKGEIHQLAIFNRALTQEEARLHYRPAMKITGDFSLDNMIPPLENEVFPFQLNISETAASLTAGQEVDLNIKPQLGFRHIKLECNKKSPSWEFSGSFQTRFWEDIFGLDARITEADNLLELTSPVELSHPIHIPGLGIAKYKDILLRIGEEQAWELSFGEHQEYGLISMVVENAIADYGHFRMGGPQLVLASPIRLDGKWLNEDMAFVSEAMGVGQVLKDSTTFSIPFTLELPPKIDPETGDAWGDPILLSDVPMTISIDVELHKEGFLGILNASFDYEGKTMSLSERRMYVAPASKMALLGDILEELKAQADTLFAAARKHQEDYYIGMGASQPNIFFGASDTAAANLTSLLPLLFGAPTQITSANSIFDLNETLTECTLTLNIAGKTQDEIRTDYDQFIGQFTLGAGGLSLLKRRIAERLPLDFDQLLYYYYGWNTTDNYLDLQAGMRLRVDLQNYQFVQASDPTAQRGFAGSGSFYIPVNSYTHNDAGNSQLLGFGPFLSRLQTESRVDIANEGAGGVLDLLKAGNRKAFYRLFFPKDPSTSLGPERVVTIIGANTAQEMAAATTGFNPDANLAPSAGVSFFFRGKAMIIPEIQVFVQNEAVYVPLGATLRQLLEAKDDVPTALSGQDLAGFAGKNRPRRLIHEGAGSTPSYRFINLNSSGVAGNRDALDLPLIKGDRIYY